MVMTMYEKALSLWVRKHITTDAELAEALNGHSIAFAYHSGKLENDRITYHDTREVFEHDGVTSYTGDLRTLFEIRNAKEAYELFLTAFGEKRTLDETLIKEFQEKLTLNTYDTRRYKLRERPGTYKLHDYVTGKEEIGAAPEDVADETHELLEELQDIPNDRILTAEAYFHAKLENIHPFADGNGRTGRLAMNYLLVLHGHPPITIHEEDRREYFAALEAWDTQQDLEPMVAFLAFPYPARPPAQSEAERSGPITQKEWRPMNEPIICIIMKGRLTRSFSSQTIWSMTSAAKRFPSATSMRMTKKPREIWLNVCGT